MKIGLVVGGALVYKSLSTGVVTEQDEDVQLYLRWTLPTPDESEGNPRQHERFCRPPCG